MTTASGKPIIGIDLGTTFSLVAVVRDGKPQVLPNAVGEKLTPSVVALDERNEILVGEAARAIGVIAPERAQALFKRDMGTNQVRKLGDRTFKPQELSALVLRALKHDAEVALGTTIDEAVVTVPAYFGDAQRQATKDAGEIAGLRVERIINEPTAAALAYGLASRNREFRAAVLDLGGGTFDVTILEIIEGVIEIQASAGDARLGGADFDEALTAYVASRLDLDRAFIGPVGWARLREACDLAKRRLSFSLSVPVSLAGLVMADGTRRDVELELTRADAEMTWRGLLDRIRAPVLQALSDAEVDASKIDEVLLVGGATRMPCVADVAATLFRKLPLRHLPPDEAVALGAAVQAALKSGDSALDDLVVTDIAPFSLGVEASTSFNNRMVTGVFSPILERGTVIPASRVERYATAHDFQRKIVLGVYQGEHAMCEANTKLGEYTIDGIPPAPARSQSIDVRFTYDLNGILEVEVSLVGSNRKEVFVIEQRPGKMTPEQVAQARAAMAALKLHPRDALPNTTALARADALHMVITGPRRADLATAIAAFRAALEAQRQDDIERARAGLNRLVEVLRQ
ncbi:MAG: Hsp70 family protein [Deltaproteobacteria bacterium]|nr:Hsp70 family protein [Deltaproteobacteria bacterium]